MRSVRSSRAEVGLRRKAQQLRVSLRGAGYEECGAVPDEDQALDFFLDFFGFPCVFWISV